MCVLIIASSNFFNNFLQPTSFRIATYFMRSDSQIPNSSFLDVSQTVNNAEPTYCHVDRFSPIENCFKFYHIQTYTSIYGVIFTNCSILDFSFIFFKSIELITTLDKASAVTFSVPFVYFITKTQSANLNLKLVIRLDGLVIPNKYTSGL